MVPFLEGHFSEWNQPQEMTALTSSRTRLFYCGAEKNMILIDRWICLCEFHFLVNNCSILISVLNLIFSVALSIHFSVAA